METERVICSSYMCICLFVFIYSAYCMCAFILVCTICMNVCIIYQLLWDIRIYFKFLSTGRGLSMYVWIVSVVCIICVFTWPDILSTVNEKVWILDPVDGTKGFMRGQHFCVALALVDRGLPRLSTMGCPNLNLYRVLQGESYDDRNIDYVDPFLLPADGGNVQQPNPLHTYIHTLYTYNFLLRPPLP